jgi:O-Antigen ligase
MLMSLKALVVVLTLATIVFVLAKPICLRFTAPEDFERRRNVWYVLTVVAFLSPSFWLYVLLAAPLLGWAAQKDASPVSVFLFFFFVIPPMSMEIPVVGINRLFELNNLRLLGLVVLVPAVFSSARRASLGGPFRLSAMDCLLLLYGLLQLVLFQPYESPTNTLRRLVLFLLDVYVVYYACSRLLGSKRLLADAMGALWLSAMVMALIASFESLRFWLLYVDIASRWGDPNSWGFLLRGSSLRAQASTGHALTLGHVLSTGLGMWMFLRPNDLGRTRTIAVFGLLSAGLLFCYSRGPWLTAMLAVMIFIALGSGNAKNLVKGALVLVALGGAFASTPFGSSIMDSLPFIGTQDQDTVEYRRQLFETSWALIKQNPLLGNPFVALDMENLRQGQGIIDLVNAYLQVALFNGLIGLALYGGVHLLVLQKGFVAMRRARAAGDQNMLALGAALTACVASNLFFMATAGQSWFQWILAGLLASYSSLALAQSAPASSPVTAAGRASPSRSVAL